MTAQPYQPAADRGEGPSADPDIIVVPEDAVQGDVVEADSGADDGAANNGVTSNGDANNGVTTDGSEDDLTDASLEQHNLSNGYPATPGQPTAPDSQAADLGQQWHDIQAMFVDDPRGSVELAAAAAEAAVSGLAETVRQQAAVPQAGADTEQLRGTLRSYRVFCQSLADIRRQLPQPQAAGR